MGMDGELCFVFLSLFSELGRAFRAEQFSYMYFAKIVSTGRDKLFHVCFPTIFEVSGVTRKNTSDEKNVIFFLLQI